MPLRDLSNTPHFDSSARMPLRSGTRAEHRQDSTGAAPSRSRSSDLRPEKPNQEVSSEDGSTSDDERGGRENKPTPPSSPVGIHNALTEAHLAIQHHRAASFPPVDDLDMEVTSPGVNENDTLDPWDPAQLDPGGTTNEPLTGDRHDRVNNPGGKAAAADEPEVDSEDDDDNEDDSKDEAYPDGYVDPTVVDPWKWSSSKNDEKVLQLGVEEMIENDP